VIEYLKGDRKASMGKGTKEGGRMLGWLVMVSLEEGRERDETRVVHGEKTPRSHSNNGGNEEPGRAIQVERRHLAWCGI
jgi:hypothetical protein